mmetsp:Transcript_50947/g.45739  ORF Transcript_50947/g.45739 Transcript_50947/m.45739 type:complete len:163 (-) Transcript_50947:137-625(-)
MSSFNTLLLFALYFILTFIDLGNCCDILMFKVLNVQNMENEKLEDLYFEATCETEDGHKEHHETNGEFDLEANNNKDFSRDFEFNKDLIFIKGRYDECKIELWDKDTWSPDDLVDEWQFPLTYFFGNMNDLGKNVEITQTKTVTFDEHKVIAGVQLICEIKK